MRTKKSKAQMLWRLLCLALILAVLTITLVQELSRSFDAYSLELVAYASYTQADSLTGYVFRDEVAPGSTGNGPVHYLANEGAAVKNGDTLATVFPNDTKEDKRAQSAALTAEIQALKAALDRENDWKNAYLKDYPLLMQSLGTASYADAATHLTQLCATLSGRECEITQSAQALRDRIDALQAQRNELEKSCGEPTPVLATMDGVFYHTADGYEQTFGTEAAATLTPEGLDALLAAPAEPTASVGKLISSGKWFLAVPATAELASTYMTDTAYTVEFEGGRLSMTLSQITPSENGEQALLLFAADTLPDFLSCARAQCVSIEKQTVTGLSLPNGALVGENQVYVKRNGVARLCTVTPILTEQGCTLVLAENTEASLYAGERVIVSARQIFDGKVLK